MTLAKSPKKAEEIDLKKFEAFKSAYKPGQA
jgi:hypothetical protein